ncbi:HAMP domain-containing sensor histidine kinase [Marivita sp. GX14005]|uniref:sensor histidine kinase n=1 Tax=Marivita sp. GX14005 TaxID=2942276 RepID=UPI002018CA73|nr:HAMP domain-containing sensor histidine kinase [Marivita sp. GX14005]MCL3883909.1 HAMP domain-containing histidine kinase [Marivita sp. GX14005]
MVAALNSLTNIRYFHKSHLSFPALFKTVFRRIFRTPSSPSGERQEAAAVDDMLHAALEHLNEDVYLYDAETLELRYLNREARARCRWRESDLQGKRIGDTVPGFDMDLFRQHTDPLLSGEKDATTIQAMHAKGPVEVVTRLILGSDGKRLFVSTLRDLSERHEIEQARMQTISMISHELRTPLTSIKGALALLNSGALGGMSPQAGDILAIANRNSDRLLNMINDILDYEKLASDKMTFSDVRIDLHKLVLEALENMKGYAELNHVRLRLERPDTPARAFGDPNRLMQVLVNLISNAAKFSPDNGEVTIRLERIDGGWRLSVHDNGPGIPEAMIAKIGQPFLQLEATQNKKHLGTGLGLTIVKRILSHYRLGLLVTSREGHGSEFAFEMPDDMQEAA